MRQLFSLAAFATAVVMLAVQPVHADPLQGVDESRWESYAHAVGDCGETSGHWVRVVQAFTWANNNLAQGDVDGFWGPNSRTALKAYQSQHSLSADGCAGYFTWDVFGKSYHMSYIGTVYGGWLRHRYQESGQSRYMTMDQSAFTWYFQWFDGWHPVDHGFNNCIAIYNYEYDPPLYEGSECHP